MAVNDTDEASTVIEYTNGKALMARGPHAMLEHMKVKLETSLGKALPQMDVRFHNLSLAADFIMADSSKNELPTISNSLKKLVVRPGSHVVAKQILKNISGVLKPGTMTLVLGQPGSGKSALMKVLSGRFPMTKNVRLEGDVTFNGKPREKLTKQLPQFVAYVPQHDKHFPTLTVNETLAFAHACCGGEKLAYREEAHLRNGSEEQNAAAIEATRALYKHYPEVVIQQLGLENCQSTVVGDAMTRGVSGGERKRVTTGEMQFGNKYVMLFDEISTGLDSAATFDIVNTQRSIATTLGKTVVIALLQPSPEVFELFDYVLLLNKGEVMYHGPCSQVVNYFQGLGYACPPEKDVADFLLDLGTEQQEKYQVKQGSHQQFVIPCSGSDFAAVFEESSIHHQMIEELHEPHHPIHFENHEKHLDPVPPFHQSFWESTKTLLSRQVTITVRRPVYMIGRLVMFLIMGLFYGTVFYQFDVMDIQVVMGLIFLTVFLLTLGQFPEMPTFFAAREIFYKQRSANFFHTASYVLSCALVQIPASFLESLLFGSIVYWMCGFVPAFGAYVIFQSVLFLTSLAFGAWFFFVSTVTPNLHVAEPLSMISVVFYLLFAGFTISKDQIPDYFVWMFWLNPVSWCLRSLSINQFLNDRFQVCVYEGVDYCAAYGKNMGNYSLSVFDFPTEKEWIYFGMIFLIFTYAFFLVLSTLALEYRRFESPDNVNLDEVDDVQDTKTTTTSSYFFAESPNANGTDMLALPVQSHESYVTPVTIAFQDLWYSVPAPGNPKESINLLKGISGFAMPGTITALMGSTGAGKTTLMDVIAARKTGGHARGKIFLNGHEATDLVIRRCAGYCEQMDIHSESSTFREALTFSAFLRQGADVPDSQKYDSVDECLELLGLEPIADQIIRGSSMEQLKRLTIGVELAAQPSVLFLDEPTSGLDARSAKLIMDGVRKVANTGRTIICTIHQPSSEVFRLFDNLLLLKRGGETVFFGELGSNASKLINYFENIPGVPRIKSDYNPATWMLEVIGAGVNRANDSNTDFASVFNSSPQKLMLDQCLSHEGMTQPSPSLPPLEFSSKRAATNLTQFKWILQRFARMYWRTPSYNITRTVISIMLALLHGFLYISTSFTTYQGINSGIGLLTMTIMFVGYLSFSCVMPLMCEERASFYRERASQTYNAFWYFVGCSLIEIPYVALNSLLFTVVLFPLVGFTSINTLLFIWLNISVHVLLQTYIGQFMAFSLPTIEIASILGVLLNCSYTLFIGFNPPTSAIPSAYKWIKAITPQSFTLSIISALMFGDCPENGDGSAIGCQVLSGTPPTVASGTTAQEYLDGVFHMKKSDMWDNFGAELLFIVVFRIATLLTLRYVNHKRT